MRQEPLDDEDFETVKHLFLSVKSPMDRSYINPAQMKSVCVARGMNATQIDELFKERRTRSWPE